MTDGIDWLRVPGAQRPKNLIPVDPPREMGGFRFAETTDGVAEDGEPIISPERGYVTDPEERQRLLGYLDGGALVLSSVSASADRVDPTRQFAVPVEYRTDGVWVWPAAVQYYLRHHHFGVEPDLRRRIVEHDYVCPPVSQEMVARALEATHERSAVLRERKEAYRRQHPRPRRGDPDRFPEDVNEWLLGLGWFPGRDVRELVDPWLARETAALAGYPFERDGMPAYEPFDAALRVLYEFGGLMSLMSGRGRTAAQTPFTIYPGGRFDDLGTFAVDVALFGWDRIDQRVFQVGDVERRMGALVVDEVGRVFAVGPQALYLGATIDEALIRLLQGIRADDVDDLPL